MSIHAATKSPSSRGLRRMAVAAIALALVGPGSALAHHSFAMFDLTREVAIKGKIVEVQWTNPHIWFELDVMEKGKAVRYSIEGSSINVLSRAGWKRTTVKPGDVVTVYMHPLKSKPTGGALNRVVLPNGTVLAPT